MQVAFVGLLPHPIRLWADMSLIKSHFFLLLMAASRHQSAAIQVLQRHDVQQRNAGEQNDEKP
ncbi:hypothetical protein [Escherichia sp. E4385]|uniref:hypothetical protein n=1 Tax=Escherichia sp. E4385 TaxID=2040639 RepID=UPI001436B3FC|nr:hypothetical protein [Escherichia sp. E4385]